MNWLSAHFWLLFEGVGGAAAVALVGWLLSRPRKPTAGSVTTRDAQVTNSPAASGSGIIQNVINFGQPPAPSAPTAAPSPKASPNIQMTGTSIVQVFERSRGVWTENGPSAEEAIIIQFTNEARQGGRNVGGIVKASLVYKDGGQEKVRIIGIWFDERSDRTEFRVDDSRKLIVAILYREGLVAIGRRRIGEHDGITFEVEPRDLADFRELTVHVRLTNANNGNVLYEGDFRVTIDPLNIVPLVTGRGEVTL